MYLKKYYKYMCLGIERCYIQHIFIKFIFFFSYTLILILIFFSKIKELLEIDNNEIEQTLIITLIPMPIFVK